MQKIRSTHKFNLKIQQILRSHELKGHAYLKITEATCSFPEFVASCKKSVYSNCSLLRYSQESRNRIEHTHFLSVLPKKLSIKI